MSVIIGVDQPPQDSGDSEGWRLERRARYVARMPDLRYVSANGLRMAVYMGGGPALMYAADAISAYDQFAQDVGEVS